MDCDLRLPGNVDLTFKTTKKVLGGVHPIGEDRGRDSGSIGERYD